MVGRVLLSSPEAPLPGPVPSYDSPEAPARARARTCRPELYEQLWAGARELNRLFRSKAVRSLDDGAVLVEAGRPVAAAYRLNKGVACRTRQTAHHRSILEIYLPGDVIGLDLVLCGDAPDAVVMAAPGAARLLPAAELLPVMASNAAVAFAVAWAANEAQRRIEALAALRRLDGEARVALALIDFYDRLHRRQLLHGLSYSLPLTQAELGDYLGMTAIHVNRVLRRLREQRIAVIEKQLVIIMNHEALARLARGDAVGAPVPP